MRQPLLICWGPAECKGDVPPPPLSFPTPCPSPGGVRDQLESGEHVQEFKVKWSRTKNIYTELVKE